MCGRVSGRPSARGIGVISLAGRARVGPGCLLGTASRLARGLVCRVTSQRCAEAIGAGKVRERQREPDKHLSGVWAEPEKSPSPRLPLDHALPCHDSDGGLAVAPGRTEGEDPADRWPSRVTQQTQRKPIATGPDWWSRGKAWRAGLFFQSYCLARAMQNAAGW